MTPSAPSRVSRRVGLVRVAALVVLAGAGVASGYILPGSSVLRRMSDAREDLHVTTFRADGAMTFFASAASEAAASGLANPDGLAEASFSFKVPGRCRLEVGLGEGARSAFVWARGQRRVEGKDLPFLGVAVEQVCALLGTGGDRAEMERYLRGLKVDWRTTALDRLSRDVAYVLGTAGANDAQLWVFKDLFAPARIRFQDPDGLLWDVRLLDYGSPQGGAAFPRVIEVSRAGELLARFTTARTDSRANLPDRLF